MHFLNKLILSLAIFSLGLLHAENQEDPQIPSVLVIGHGFMGANHVKNLEVLQKENKVRIAGIVDIDGDKLKNLSYPVFLSAAEALQNLSPEIVVVAPNTKEHFDVLKTLLNTSFHPALFIEKPLVETSLQAQELMAPIYSANIPIACGYLFRHSPIIEPALCYIEQHHLKVEDIQVTWQKQRAPTRPSAGVHIDEATHPVDLILNQILPALNMPNKPISLLCSSRKYEDSIVDRNQQLKLYQDHPEKLIPLAEVEFQIRTPNVVVHVLSSFVRAPQIREIVLNCSSQTKIRLVFDKDQTDQLEITSSQKTETAVFEKPNKLLLEWRAFLDYYHTRNSSNALATLQDMADDILITELLDEIPLNQEISLKNFDLQAR